MWIEVKPKLNNSYEKNVESRQITQENQQCFK